MHVAFADPFVGRHLLEEQHHPPPHLAGQQVVEVLDRARPQARIGLCERRADGGDVFRRVEQAEQAEDPVDRRAVLLGQHLRQAPTSRRGRR